MIDELTSELERTGLTLREFGHLVARKHRKHVEAETIRTLIQDERPKLPSDALPELLPILSEMPDKPAHTPKSPYNKASKRIAFDTDMHGHLVSELERTQIVITDIARRLKPERGSKALNQRLTQWRHGDAQTVPQDEWLAVIGYLEALPNARKPAPSLKSEKPKPAQPMPQRSAPPIAKPSRPPKRAVITNVDDTRAISDLSSDDLPQVKPRPRMKTYRLGETLKRLGYILISDDLYTLLHEERRRTLVSPRRLIASAKQPPPNLASKQVRDWLLGNTLAAEKEHLDWVLKTYASLPDANDQ